MKYINMILAVVLVSIVAVNAAQKTSFTQREVRDPRQLAVHLEANAADAESRFQAVSAYFADGILSQGGLAIDTDASEFKTTSTVYYTLDGIQYSKAATTALVFTAANTINVGQSTNSAFYGSWLIEVNAAGTVATKPAGGLTNQVYTSPAASLAALPAPTAANVAIGTVTIKADAGDAFTANTTDMTTNSTTFVDAAIKVMP
jgi:hypothetical protein